MFLNNILLHKIIVHVCASVIKRLKIIDEISNESLDIIGAINSLLRKPNSRSKIKGKPALIDPVKAVKIMIPGLKNVLYCMFDVKSPTGAF